MHLSGPAVLQGPIVPLPRDPKTRVRKRIRGRLEELNMTGRQLAVAIGKSDAWISGVLSGSQALSLDDFDAIADELHWSPSELVRHDDSELRELRPHEMRLLRHYQRWPEQIQERWLRVLDFFAAMTPDEDSARLLDLWRDLSIPARRRLRLLLEQSPEDILPPIESPGPRLPATTGEKSRPNTTAPARQGQTEDAIPTRDDDRHDEHRTPREQPLAPPKKRK